jgi:TolB-like protein/Flp pilus assembly protein TadD
MARVLRICKKCGLTILVDEPEGLCAACLLETSLGMLHGEVNGAGGMELPEELGDYQLLEEIGRGGQGLVYRARQKSLNRMVALKVIGLGRWATKAHIKRFRLEAEAAASLDHPSIVPIHEIGESDGSCYFSMQLVEGRRLDEVINREPMSNRGAAELIIKLARTISYAHKRGILHRDIKPGNILIDVGGEPHLTDFGLARLIERENTITGTLVEALGTPSYMAPEQAAGDVAQLTSATDVYGLGAILYQLLTGQPPFVGGTIYETVRLVLETEPRHPRLLNPKADRDLATICLKCIEKDPKRRYSSALALGEDLERCLRHEPIRARRAGVLTRGRKWVQRKPAAAGLIASLVGLAMAVGVIGIFVWKSDLIRPAATGIAVLPFENLSNDREDASFADGVQDDLVTKLANIAALKVISRTSVMQYRGEHNTREVGESLRVSHVLEGSVRKTGAWLHINAQLIDTRTDSHIWAKQYDGDLKDVFTIQSEIAEKVAEQLHAKISPAEKLAIERPPTADLTAFDLYNRAKNLLLTSSYTTTAKTKLSRAADLLTHAVARDPSFFQAYCQLASAHNRLYFFGDDHTPTRLALAEAAIQSAFRLRPDGGEAHLARAENRYEGHLDYDGALAELEVAAKSLSNEPRLFELEGYIQRRQGKQEQALRSLERAVDLDPRNIYTLEQTALSYDVLRRYRDEEVVWDRALSIQPNDVQTRISRALVELNWKADTRPLHEVIDEIRAKDPAATQGVVDTWLACALAERDLPATASGLAVLGEGSFGIDTIRLSRSFAEGLIARMMKDDAKAGFAFTKARAEQEKIVETQPNDGLALCVLGLIDAGLGRKEEALREGRRASELLPVEKDAINGPIMVKYLAIIAAWVGDKNLACEQLSIATSRPSYLSYGELRLLSFWDPLRGDPRFEKIVASLAPKVN